VQGAYTNSLAQMEDKEDRNTLILSQSREWSEHPTDIGITVGIRFTA
jgi:hypothetical protein